MTPPAKKTTPAVPNKEHSTLSDILGKDKVVTSKDAYENRPDHVHSSAVEPTVKPNDFNDGDVPDLPIGPDNDKDDVLIDVEDSTKNTDSFGNNDFDGDNKRGNDGEPYVSPEVVALKADKTPAELAAESPEETAKRYGVDTSITDEDADNPNVQVYRDTRVNQVPSGTHLHPDIAKDLLNRGISEQHTDNAQVKRMVTETYAFAPDAETNDKFDDTELRKSREDSSSNKGDAKFRSNDDDFDGQRVYHNEEENNKL